MTEKTLLNIKKKHKKATKKNLQNSKFFLPTKNKK